MKIQKERRSVESVSSKDCCRPSCSVKDCCGFWAHCKNGTCSLHRWDIFCRCGLRRCIGSIIGVLALWAGLTVTLHVARTSGDESCPRTRFEMLALFSRELEGTGIAWFVHYGTLLGAVRDQAIIPWCFPTMTVCMHVLVSGGVLSRNFSNGQRDIMKCLGYTC